MASPATADTIMSDLPVDIGARNLVHEDRLGVLDLVDEGRLPPMIFVHEEQCFMIRLRPLRQASQGGFRPRSQTDHNAVNPHT